MKMPKKKIIEKAIEIQPSTLENIDWAFFDWVNLEMNIFCSTNVGWKKVSVIWAGQERSAQIKKYKDLRDPDGALIFPIISIKRESVAKDPARKGQYYGNVYPNDSDGGSVLISKRIKSDKTAKFCNEDQFVKTGQINFAIRKNQKRPIVYETLFIPMPVHLKIVYKIEMKTQFQQQMNEMLQSFEAKTFNINYFRFGKNGHAYEGFFPSEANFNNNDIEMGEEERIFNTSFDVEVIGYIFSQDKNHLTPKIIKKESIAEVKLKIGKEQILIADSDWSFLK